MHQAIASSFTTAAILTLVVPVALLTIVALFWALVLGKSDLDDELDQDTVS
jgi:hypothetical protein